MASYALQVVLGQTIVWVLIVYGVSLSHIILSVLIRLHIVAKYEIKSQSVCMECMTGFFCFCCSTAQSEFL